MEKVKPTPAQARVMRALADGGELRPCKPPYKRWVVLWPPKRQRAMLPCFARTVQVLSDNGWLRMCPRTKKYIKIVISPAGRAALEETK